MSNFKVLYIEYERKNQSDLTNAGNPNRIKICSNNPLLLPFMKGGEGGFIITEVKKE